LIDAGYSVTVGVRLENPDAPATAGFDAGVRVEHLPFVRQPSPLADLRALWATIALIRRIRPDLVNASTPKAALLGMIAARVCRVPVRVEVIRGLRFETATGWRRRLYRFTERLAIACATHVIFNSPSLRSVALEHGLIAPGTGEILAAGSGNGIDLTRFDPAALPDPATARRAFGVSETATVIGYVGRFTADKGIADLISVMQPRLIERPDAPEVALLLVGDFEAGDPLPEGIRRAIDTNAHIIHIPWLDDPRSAYAAMDLLVFPSAREGLPNVILEAQACGIPAIAYGATGTVDALADGRTGIIVPLGDRAALGAAIDALLTDPQRARELGDAGRIWVRERFDQRLIWDALLARYHSWLDTAPG